MGGKSWHAIKNLSNPPFLILKPAETKVFEVYCIVRDSRSGCDNDFQCTCEAACSEAGHAVQAPEGSKEQQLSAEGCC